MILGDHPFPASSLCQHKYIPTEKKNKLQTCHWKFSNLFGLAIRSEFQTHTSNYKLADVLPTKTCSKTKYPPLMVPKLDINFVFHGWLLMQGHIYNREETPPKFKSMPL